MRTAITSQQELAALGLPYVNLKTVNAVLISGKEYRYIMRNGGSAEGYRSDLEESEESDNEGSAEWSEESGVASDGDVNDSSRRQVLFSLFV